jgi:DNA-directed RNA polymerase subunit RPC12/RpoP
MNTGALAYVVIVCSRCRLARGAAETARTASCPNCGRKLQVGELRKYYRSESLDQIREAIGQLNARLKGGLDIYLEDLYASVPDTKPRTKDADGEEGGHPAHPVREEGAGRHLQGTADADEAKAREEDERIRQMGRAVPTNKLDRAIILCMMGRGPASSEELLPLLPMKCTIEQLDKRLEALRRTGLVYEPRAGKYALVD